MRQNRRAARVFACFLMMLNLIGCTKRVILQPYQYEEVIGGEDFVHVRTTDGKAFQLQDARVNSDGVTGLLRHTKGDIRPVGFGGQEPQSAWIEIKLEDIQSIEVERINKKRVVLLFGLIGAGLVAAITTVEILDDANGGGGSGGEPPIKPD